MVVLSSCHAASLSRAAEEPVGVATAVLVGGAKAVVAPLWEVDEFATLLFFKHFYTEIALPQSKMLSEVVRNAQIALRSMHACDVLIELEQIVYVRESQSIRRYIEYIRQVEEKSNKPYSDPFFWSAFVVIGSDVQLPAY